MCIDIIIKKMKAKQACTNKKNAYTYDECFVDIRSKAGSHKILCFIWLAITVSPYCSDVAPPVIFHAVERFNHLQMAKHSN